MSDAPERIVPSCVEALESYQQADMDGVMVLASRQAIHETIDAYWARVETCEELEAALDQAQRLLIDTVAQLEDGNIKSRRLRAEWIRQFLAERMWIRRFLAELKGQDDE